MTEGAKYFSRARFFSHQDNNGVITGATMIRGSEIVGDDGGHNESVTEHCFEPVSRNTQCEDDRLRSGMLTS